MQSILDPRVTYTDLSRDVSEHDVDVVSDLWSMDGRDVYRGSRDRHYSHANVYWLYSEDLERVGLVEHSLENNADFRILWFYDNAFSTFFQEEWTVAGSLWSTLPRTTVERFISEDLVTPDQVLAACLYGNTRILTMKHVLQTPTVHSCSDCGWKSLKKLDCGDLETPLEFPDKSKILFIDDDLYVCQPPADSKVWRLLGFTLPLPPRDDAPASLESGQVQEPEEQMATPPPQTPSQPEPHPEYSSQPGAEQP
jgi:hypothetical protein